MGFGRAPEFCRLDVSSATLCVQGLNNDIFLYCSHSAPWQSCNLNKLFSKNICLAIIHMINTVHEHLIFNIYVKNILCLVLGKKNVIIAYGMVTSENNCCFWVNQSDSIFRMIFQSSRNDCGYCEREHFQRELIQHNFKWYLVMKQVLMGSREVPPLL